MLLGIVLGLKFDRKWVKKIGCGCWEREREREWERLQNEPHALPKYNQTQEYNNLSRNTTKLTWSQYKANINYKKLTT